MNGIARHQAQSHSHLGAICPAHGPQMVGKTIVQTAEFANGQNTVNLFSCRSAVPNGRRDLTPPASSPVSVGFVPLNKSQTEEYNLAFQETLQNARAPSPWALQYIPLRGCCFLNYMKLII